MQRRRVWSALSAALVIAATGTVVAAAVDADGYNKTRTELLDEGVFVSIGKDKAMGYISKSRYLLEYRVPIRRYDIPTITQYGQTLVTRSEPLALADVWDTRTMTPVGTLQEVPEGSQLDHGGTTLALLIPADGTVQIAPSTALAQLVAEDVEPALAVDASAATPAAFAVGRDGRVHVVSTENASVVTVEPGQAPGEPDSLASATPGQVEVSAAGSSPLVLDLATRVLSLPGGVSADLSAFGELATLQQPSDDPDTALVATESSLLAVDVDSGEVLELASDGTGAPARPVRDRGDSYVAWNGAALGYVVRGDGSRFDYDTSGRENARLVWRVGRGLIALNDVETGAAAIVTDDDELRQLGDEAWENALQKQEQEEGASDSQDAGTAEVQDEQLDPNQVPPVANPDTRFGTREGRSVSIPVLANDTDANGDLLIVSEVSAAVSGGTAGVVSNGAAVVFTPDGTASGSFTYSASDGIASAPATVSVKVYPADGTGNLPPKRLDETTAQEVIEVAADQPFEVNLLRGWFDPEGDAFGLGAPPQVTPEDLGSIFVIEPDGRLAAPGGLYDQAVEVTLTYDLVDEFGDSVTAKFTIKGVAEAEPKAFPDTVIARQGETVAVDVLANDLGANLVVGRVESVTSDRVRGQAVEAGQQVAVRSDVPGEYLLTYELKVAGSVDEPVLGQIRLVVPDPSAENLAPSASPDVVFAKPGIPAVFDVLRNDSDPNADVLVLANAVSAEPGRVEVATLENRFVRAQIDDFPSNGSGLRVAYTVSDGVNSSTGFLTVLRDPFGGDRPPVLRPDVRTIRAGGVLSIDVLANDTDPDTPLHLAPEAAVTPKGDGTAGVWGTNGDRVTFIPSGASPLAAADYRVAGSTATAPITVNVIAQSGSNTTLERLPDVTARVLAGQSVTIVPPLDADAEGDPLVLVTGTSNADDALGVATVDVAKGVIVFTADALASGLDSFTYTVEEQYGNKATITGTVWLGVAQVQALLAVPIANPDVLYVTPGETRRVDVLANDLPTGEVELVGFDALNPNFGQLSQDGNALVYSPPPGVDEGEFTLRYRAGLNGLSSSGMVTVVLAPDRPNLAPIVTNGLVRVSPGEVGVFDAQGGASDPDADGAADLTVTLVEPVPPGATLERGVISYSAAQPPGATVFFRVTDGGDAFTEGFVKFEVENRAPVSIWQIPPPIDGDRPFTIDLTTAIDDPDGDAWQLEAGVQPTVVNGSINAVEGNRITITPNADTRNAQVSVTVRDLVSNRVVTLTFDLVVNTNLDPRPVPVNLTVPSKGINAPQPITIDPGDSDEADRGTHRIDGSCSAPAGFSVQQQGPVSLTVTSDQPRGASAVVQCTIVDSRDKRGTATINVSVGPTDRARPSANPVTFDLRLGKDGGSAVTLPLPIDDPLGNGVDVTLVGAPSLGVTASISGSGSSWTMTLTPPSDGFSGQTQFGYRVTDTEDRVVEAAATATLQGRPRAPGTPTAVAGDATITVSWPPSPPNGVPISYYEVLTDGAAPQRVGTTNTATFNQLENNRQYSFTVVACPDPVEWGCSDPSSPSVAVTPDTLPLSPGALTATRGDGRVDLSWTAPARAGSDITGYLLTCDQCGGAARPFPAGTTSFAWTGLTNGTTYTFSVASTKTLLSTQANVASPAVQATAMPAGLPFAPVVGTPGIQASGDVSLTWSPADGNGEPVTSYSFEVRGAGGTCSSTGPTSATCAGIPPGSNVGIAVRGTNVVGPGAFGESPAVVVARTPSQPTITSIQGNGATAAISINGGDGGGVALTQIEIRRNGAVVGTIPYQTSFNVDTPVGGTYTFAVRVLNNATFWSAYSGDTRQVAGQGTPVITAFTGQNGSGADQNTMYWTWSVAANSADITSITVDGVAVNANGSAPSFGVAGGCGASLTRTMVVTYAWDGIGRGTLQQQATATTPACPPPPPPPPPPQSITVGVGPQASVTGCTSTDCRYFAISLSGFSANTTYTVTCYADGTFVFSFSARTNNSGSYFTQGWCVADQSWNTVTVVVGPVSSGNVPWY